jgi:hypothetical protein
VEAFISFICDRIARLIKINQCINYGPLKIMCIPPILTWCFFMAYSCHVKCNLAKDLGHSAMTLKIVGLKIGCPKTWMRTCRCWPYHMTLVPFNVKRRAIWKMSPNLGKTHYRALSSGSGHTTPSPIST